jgi:hypothetical protein
MGAPLGNKNATKNRLWDATLRRALLASDGEKLRELAEKLIEKALEGDVSALREIGDRIDGKAAQQLIHSGDADQPVVGKIVCEIVKPGSIALPLMPDDSEGRN